MNKTIISALLLMTIAAGACNSEANKNAAQDSTTLKSTSGENKKIVYPLGDLKLLAGKYPREVKLLEDAKLKPRLQTLLGDHYNDFVKYWGTETPITAEAEVIMTSGCEQHNCGSNSYLLYIDLMNDNINVYHIFNGKLTDFSEKGKIKLPENMQRDFDTIIANSKS